ncbi:MAG: flagellar biosynthesis protein FlhB [Planctomycetota bacterium]
MSDGPDRDEKTEEATARRREEARDKGQVAYSSEVVVIAMLAAVLGALMLIGGRSAASAGGMLHSAIDAMGQIGTSDLTAGDASAALVESMLAITPGAFMIVAPMLLLGLLAGFGQVGIHFSAKAIEFDVSKLNPVSGFSKIFSPRSWMRTLMGALKVTLVGGVMIAVTMSLAPRTGALSDVGVRPFLAAVGYVLLRATAAALLVLLALAVFDFYFQRYQHNRDLKMTKKEVKDEARNSDGDPAVKARIRQVQRELSSRRMMEDVPDATVVITNPTHVAVALRYDDARQTAPIVVAKGLDEVALAIRAVASEHGVIIHEEPPLARALHRHCEIGDPIPADLFEAVARVLAYVYRVQGRDPVRA